MIVNHPPLLNAIRSSAVVRDDSSHDYDPLLRLVCDRAFVLLQLDETTAVEPFDITERWITHELPDAYPFGL